MKKNWKNALSLLFVLIFMLQIAGMSASADNTGATAGLGIEVYVPYTDEFGNESSQKLDGETVTLPEGLSLELQLGSSPIGTDAALTLQSLMDNDLKITPPEGYYISELYIAPYPCDPFAQILLEGEAAASGTAITLKKEKFVDNYGNFDDSRLTTTGESYSLIITLEKLEDVETVSVFYGCGDVDATVPEGSSAPAGSSFSAPALSDTESAHFTGWLLRYRSTGAELEVAANSSVQPYADCALIAQWETIEQQQEPEQPAHEHSWYELSNTATCTEAGVRTFACTGCDETLTEDCAALGHNYEVTSVVEPTVDAQGYTVYTCTRCGDSYNDNFTEKLTPHEHDWVFVSDTATCTEAGVRTFACTGCDDTYSEPSEALNHNYVAVVPTCFDWTAHANIEPMKSFEKITV